MGARAFVAMVAPRGMEAPEARRTFGAMSARVRRPESQKPPNSTSVHMKKRDISKFIAEKHTITQKKACMILATLAALAADSIERFGMFALPGLVVVRSRFKPAITACKKEIKGKWRDVKARPARRWVDAVPFLSFSRAVARRLYRRALLALLGIDPPYTGERRSPQTQITQLQLDIDRGNRVSW